MLVQHESMRLWGCVIAVRVQPHPSPYPKIGVSPMWNCRTMGSEVDVQNHPCLDESMLDWLALHEGMFISNKSRLKANPSLQSIALIPVFQPCVGFACCEVSNSQKRCSLDITHVTLDKLDTSVQITLTVF